MLARPEDIERLCDVWLSRAVEPAGVPDLVRQVLPAVCNLIGATGAGLALDDGTGYLATGDLAGRGSAELVEGNDDIHRRPDGVLVRRSATAGKRRFTALFRFAADAFDASASPRSADAAVSAIARALGRMVPVEERRFGDYELLALIAEGGMAQVHLARRVPEGDVVALKRIRSHLASDQAFLKLFFAEMATASRVEHPNVVRILEFGVEGSRPYMAMELLRGGSLAELSRRARAHGISIGPGVVVALAGHYLSGLAAVHARGVVHCDLSPQNLFVTFEGAGKIVDFGVARAASSHREDSDSLRGKLGYLAPEQLAGGVVDPRADLYALGVVVYELLLGGRVSSPLEAVRRYTRGEVPDLVALDPTLPKQVARATMGALALDPAQRHPSALDFHDALLSAAVADGLELASAQALVALMRDAFGDQDAALKRLLAGSPTRSDGPGTVRLE